MMSPGKQFDQDGYLSPIDVLNEAEAAEVRQSFDELESRIGKEQAQIGLVGKERVHPFIWKFATHPGLLDAVEQVAGPDLLLIGTHIFCKYPSVEMGKEAFVAWHQDVTYWGLEPPKAFTAWLAIDDADDDNGAMLVIPQSHKSGILSHGKSEQQGNLLSVNQAIAEDRLDPDSAVTIVLKAGQISLHAGLAVHGSQPNRSSRRRCGMTVRFTTPEVSWIGDENQKFDWQAVLVRGEDRYRNIPLLPEPDFS